MRGVFLDVGQVKVASMDNPLSPGQPLEIAWSGRSVPAGIHLHRLDQAGETTVGVNVAFAPPTAESLQATRMTAGTAEVGSGFEGVGDHPNMYKEDNACYTVWFTPEFPTQLDSQGFMTQHQMNTCWEVWAQDATVHFVYNRWATWTLAVPSSSVEHVFTQDFSILSRPWSGGGAIAQLNSSTPAQGSSNCVELGSATIGGTYSGITAQVTIPVHKCTTTWVHFDANQKMFGLDWDGFTSNRQLFLDAAGDYNAINATALPSWADQTYVSTHSCENFAGVGSCTAFPADTGWKYQDAGW
jgi:hypothetical protein